MSAPPASSAGRTSGLPERAHRTVAAPPDGNLGAAVSECGATWRSIPQSAPAQYNLAVLLDAQGEYEAAMDLYDQAIKNGSKDFYADSRAECARRLANQNAMQQ